MCLAENRYHWEESMKSTGRSSAIRSTELPRLAKHLSFTFNAANNSVV